MLQQNPIDPSLPEAVPVQDATGWALQLDTVLDALFTPATPPLLPMGENLWRGLALIVVAWTGLRIAFAGAAFRPWELVTLVTGLMIPLWMLRFYAVDVPGVGLSFPMLIPAGADQIAGLFQADIGNEINKATLELSEGFRQNLAAVPTRDAETGRWLGIGGAIRAGLQNFTSWLLTFVFGFAFTLAFIAIYAICLAQVFWAKLALAVLVFLGPVMIPWLVWRPMSFLFWGWFRAMLTYSFYSIIAAAILRVWVAISLTMINSVNNAILAVGQPDQGPEATVFLLATIPLLFAAFLAALKIPELAGALVGSPGGGSGFLGVAASAASGGAARVAKLAGGAVK